MPSLLEVSFSYQTNKNKCQCLQRGFPEAALGDCVHKIVNPVEFVYGTSIRL
jgi:hypothetical protein